MIRTRIARILLANLAVLSMMGVLFQADGCSQRQVVQQWVATVTSTYLSNFFNDQFQTTGGLGF